MGTPPVFSMMVLPAPPTRETRRREPAVNERLVLKTFVTSKSSSSARLQP